ncbi:MAG: hypothetical protein NXI30_04550 [bacterium]|nr:hypothetical protein [bacterium]
MGGSPVIDKQTGISIGLALTLAAAVGAFTLDVKEDITRLDERQSVIKADTDKIPSIEKSISSIRTTVNRIEAANDSAFSWKKPDMEVWCLRTERKNDGWICADPYTVRNDD